MIYPRSIYNSFLLVKIENLEQPFFNEERITTNTLSYSGRDSNNRRVFESMVYSIDKRVSHSGSQFISKCFKSRTSGRITKFIF